MYFKQILYNIKKNRKDNGLFFATLLIAIVAFYTLLSLESQDVMRFLNALEGDAIQKLMLLVPIIYVVSLFFVFFLVYFAYAYQMENRRREFGLYLMFGMKRGRLFLMLMCETILNSILSVFVGIPLALLLTESISLTTARLVGLGIIGHQFSLSPTAILGTVGGFFLVQLAAMLILSVRFCRMDPADLLKQETEAAKKPTSGKQGIFSFLSGILLLAVAYVMGVTLLRAFGMLPTLLILIFGSLGTFRLYRGLGSFIERALTARKSQKSGLYTFTGRQIQESVVHQHSSLAVSSLLLLTALACISFGIGMGVGRTGADARACDFSLMGTKEDVTAFIQDEENQNVIGDCYPMFIGNMYYGDSTFSLDGIVDAFETLPENDLRDNIVENLRQDEEYNDLYLIPLKSFNALLASMGEEKIQLADNQVAFYSRMAADSPNYKELWDQALRAGAYVEFTLPNGNVEKFEILPGVYYNNIVADRAITLSTTLVVPDDLYATCARHTSDKTDSADETGQMAEDGRAVGSAGGNAGDVATESGESTPLAGGVSNFAQDNDASTEPDTIDNVEDPFAWNIRLKDDVVKTQGLLPAIMEMQSRLDDSALSYDSYLGGIGRNLFYTVAASYLSIYLGVLFLLIANTVLVLKYLIWQRKNHGRYLTLMMLGAKKRDLSISMGKQIRLYFLLVLGVAVSNSVFAIWSMFTSFVKLPAGTSMLTAIILACVALVCFVLVEVLYICIVQHKSRKEILALHVSERPE